MLCIGRHQFLSEHLCRLFRDVGAVCEPAVGVAQGLVVARAFEPHLIVVEADLLNSSVLDTWSQESVLAGAPVLAVSLTRRPEESVAVDLCGLAGVVYLPSLNRAGVLALLESARKPRGVDVPPNILISPPRQSAALH